MSDASPLEENLNKIEVGIRQLKVQYDMFFSGAMPRQPFESRKELEIMIKSLGDSPMQRFADRYRFNMLASRYQTMVELWSKMLRAKEEGRLRPGIPGFVEPVRRQAAAPPAAAAATAAAGPRAAAPAGDSFSFQDPSAEDASFRVFYDRYLEASRKTGAGSAGRVSYEKFLKQITAKTRSIKEKSGCEAVSYSIVMKDGAVSLKASPVKQKGGKP